MYKNLFIDLDDTLWAFSENSKDTFYEVYISHYLNRYFNSFTHFYSLYHQENERLWSDYSKGLIKKEDLNTRRFLYPLQAVGVNDEKLAKTYSDNYFAIVPTKKVLMPYAKEAIEYLHSKYRLFILSNGFRELQSEKMISAGIYNYFNKIILSEDIWILKPHPEIFNFALSATQSQLKESLMIGDSWEADIVGAKSISMDQMYYNPSMKPVSDFTPTYVLNSWEEVSKIL